MSSDEESDYFSASEGEGEGIVIQLHDRDETEDGDNDQENDDRSKDEEEDDLNKRLENLQWRVKPKRTRKKKKDVLSAQSRLLFSPTSIIDSFNQFMSSDLKELLIKYTNMKGK